MAMWRKWSEWRHPSISEAHIQRRILKDIHQFSEAIKLEKLLSGWRGGEFGVLEHPGIFMEEMDGVEARGQRGIDVGFWTVADHPCGARIESMSGEHGVVCLRVFFGDDFDGGEVRSQSAAMEFIGLFGVIALGHQDQTMATGQRDEGFPDSGEQLDLLTGDGLNKAVDTFLMSGGDGRGAEAGKALQQRMGEAVQTIAVAEYAFALNGVEGLAHLRRSVLPVVEIAGEGGNGALKVDVVFP